jgi:uncharacterized protein (TIGR02145 family)
MMKIEQRVALVIGINHYDHDRLSDLKNPINDARAMRSALKKLGFKVIYGEDLSVREMDKKLRAFGNEIRKGGVGLFFFAGHGIEADRENYLLGKNSNVDAKDEIAYESLELEKVLEKMEKAGNRLNIVLLDACRNDPFSRSGGGGLAKASAHGVFIAYATSPGNVASDGRDDNGVFTKNVLRHINDPGQPIERVFKNIKRDVYEQTGGKQRPWTNSDIIGDFFFVLPDPSSQALSSKNNSTNLPKKIALVMGNNNYRHITPLQNALNDSRAVKKRLVRNGYEVIYGENLTRIKMLEKLEEFASALNRGDTAVLYFAGHGQGYRDHGYLAAVDSRASSANDFPYEMIDMELIFQSLKSIGTKENIIVVDSNFANAFVDKKFTGNLTLPANTVFALAAQPNKYAQDGKNGNGLFTEHLLKQFDSFKSFDEILNDTKLAVQKASNNSQIPWIISTEDNQLSSMIHNGVTYGTVTSPHTGKIWLDRNLGAKRVCQSFNDEQCYGDYYQWGRAADGHEKVGSSSFTIIGKSQKYDWKPSDSSGSQRQAFLMKTDGSGICPRGFRVPTIDELLAETLSQGVKNLNDVFSSFLKLPSAGSRFSGAGNMTGQDRFGFYGSSSPVEGGAEFLIFSSGFLKKDSRGRLDGVSVRCIKD